MGARGASSRMVPEVGTPQAPLCTPPRATVSSGTQDCSAGDPAAPGTQPARWRQRECAGRLGSEAAPGRSPSPTRARLTLRRPFGRPVTPTRSQGPGRGTRGPRLAARTAHALATAWAPGRTQAPSQSSETLSAGVCWDSGHAEALLSAGWKLLGRQVPSGPGDDL